ncbi:MAG: 2-amino-4-hydroxy-6-hydroxymethyldihydropteridine diphosphokinase [Candidatus Methylacidiphilales bacterium]
MKTEKVGIALGSNLGDRGQHLRLGFDFLRSLSFSDESEGHFLASRIYLTEPVDCPPGSPPFLNAVAEISTTLTPEALLARLQGYERHLGRPEVRPVNSPRPLDLDILYIGARQIATDHLIVPHPRMTQRLFVLVPLTDIRPGLVLPGESQTVRELADHLLSETVEALRPEPADC